jgi:hypothetical protein
MKRPVSVRHGTFFEIVRKACVCFAIIHNAPLNWGINNV